VAVPIARQRFPDVLTLLVAHYTGYLGDGHAGVETPADLAGALPFVRVSVVGGSSDQLNGSTSVDIDVFAASYATGEPLAANIREDITGPPPAIRQLDRVECESAPQELPWGDGDVRRFGATYRITARRVRP
jgi:hypothetical protein